jgi:hypothetical protein
MSNLILKECHRCGGALIYNKFCGSSEQFWGWKCLICGEIVDSIILENRQIMKVRQEMGLSDGMMKIRR